MTQDEKWMIHYNEVVEFIKNNKLNPSKYVDSERGLRIILSKCVIARLFTERGKVQNGVVVEIKTLKE